MGFAGFVPPKTDRTLDSLLPVAPVDRTGRVAGVVLDHSELAHLDRVARSQVVEVAELRDKVVGDFVLV